jgi:hypothetical protein
MDSIAQESGCSRLLAAAPPNRLPDLATEFPLCLWAYLRSSDEFPRSRGRTGHTKLRLQTDS